MVHSPVRNVQARLEPTNSLESDVVVMNGSSLGTSCRSSNWIARFGMSKPRAGIDLLFAV